MSAALRVSLDTATQWLGEALGLHDGETPFPWQVELLASFAKGKLERSLDIPTGLGKTAVMAIWLVARAAGAPLPRRLVYVVDRRAVVDQATEVAEGLRSYVGRNEALRDGLGLDKRRLPISTLRGQHVDNREWLEDPASPAIVVGTVDMVGSRLLFEGYGTSRKMRPYHAGLLGADTLVVLDEAHLVPPFEKLLEAVADGGATLGPQGTERRSLVPSFNLLCLSATGRIGTHKPFGLTAPDMEHKVVRKRLDAPKHLVVKPREDRTALSEALADEAWNLAEKGKRATRCIVFCHKREVAAATKAAIEKRAGGDKKAGVLAVPIDTELFVGGRRVFERVEAASRLKALGFIAGTEARRDRAAFVFATSAGEVGVDLDADDMVSDLVAWERMVQRLGRVNRRGAGVADVIVIAEPAPLPTKAVQTALAKDADERKDKEAKAIAAYEASVKQARALLGLIEKLPRKNGSANASPSAFYALRGKAEHDADLRALLDDGSTPAPLRPALTRALVEAWAMTSLRNHTGRPEIEPWLRGWIEDDPPQTTIAWRTHLPVRTRGDAPSNEQIEAFFEAAPVHASEVLESETFRVVEWLTLRAKAIATGRGGHGPGGADQGLDADAESAGARLGGRDAIAFILTSAGDCRTILRLDDLVMPDDDKEASKRRTENLEGELSGAMLVVDARVGGLNAGLLDDGDDAVPRTIDDGAPWSHEATSNSGEPASSAEPPMVRFRVRRSGVDQTLTVDPKWRERLRFAIEVTSDGEPTRWLVVDKWRHDASTEEDRSAGRPQRLEVHQAWTERRARDLAHRLGLPDPYVEMLAVAAGLHDRGKEARRWQRAFHAATDAVYAKTRGPVSVSLLDGYRHEFGSLPLAVESERLQRLPGEQQELALHLIAAHHGFARPVIGVDGCEDSPPSVLEQRAQEVALRFVKLQKQWGPWGLAWWEALLRAADQQASRANDEEDSPAAKEGL